MRRRRIVFIGGVHGVGKTTLCNELAARFNIEHFSASNLIAREKEEEHLRNKQVENIAGNQDHLVVAINKYFNSTSWYLLDGHWEHPTFAKILAARQDRGVRLGTPSHDSQRD